MPKNVNGTGPSTAPSRTLTKKLAYTQSVALNNSTSTYAYYSKYVKPDLTAAVGASVQFAAYELFRIKKMKVSIQAARSASTDSISPINVVPLVTVWTAADWGANETVSGESIMQYQNAKKNTISLNKWTRIVDTTVRANGTMGVEGVPSSSTCIVPPSTWFNTSGFGTGSFWNSGFSGYQLFIQGFGCQSIPVAQQPAFTVVTELHVEFMQPAFQNNASAFATSAFGMRMVTIPDAADPDSTRVFVFDRITIDTDSSGERVMSIRLKREDGQSGSLTYTASELRAAIASGTSGQYFGGRRIIYDGPYPPVELPQQSLIVESI